jgi:hypothetical protein
MQIGFRDLCIWSFLMVSAHGASFMLLPILLKVSALHAAAGRGSPAPHFHEALLRDRGAARQRLCLEHTLGDG